MRALLRTLSLACLLAACGGPCDELDHLCERCGQTLQDCKYLVTWLSSQKCDEVLTRAGDACPYRYLPR